MGFLKDLKTSSTQAQLLQLATSLISLVLIIRRFRTAGKRVTEYRVAAAQQGNRV